jgi:hypothetical protein
MPCWRGPKYFADENRVLREQFGPLRLPFNDDQRIRFALKAKQLGGGELARSSVSLVRPDTLLVFSSNPYKMSARWLEGSNRFW